MRVLLVAVVLSIVCSHTAILAGSLNAPPRTTADATDAECRCGHGPNATCPMHARAGAGRGRGLRWCAGCPDQPEAVLSAAGLDSSTPPVAVYTATLPSLLSYRVAESTVTPLDGLARPLHHPPRF